MHRLVCQVVAFSHHRPAPGCGFRPQLEVGLIMEGAKTEA